MARRPPRWYFSFRSPYSWFAYRDLMLRYPDIADAIEWIPFWEPDERSGQLLEAAGLTFPYTPMSRDKHFYILQDTRRLAEERGLAMVWPVDRAPHWEVAHLAFLAARAHGLARPFADAVYAARWERGVDISDVDVVSELAVGVGLEPTLVATALDDPESRADGVAALAASARDGVFGVPFFISGRHKFWGVERLPAFAQLLRAATQPASVDAPVAGLPVAATADAGHAGGCG
ncbi:2-hydroxychromene-2-carboxylate isomerase [Micromonospora tarensis]|uniref:2-hydroxychromene-2-carboxylate isomerase n=1 Tax=Micromonospora tarensis TaxID=2806100 RepID=A0ABS1YKS3_9ACTN|nr:DsbA family protein [Micromonospora tarensis]MBM0278019.1 DsbA family protein [Micromonospora tarensis]